jgi:hypothetical protein
MRERCGKWRAQLPLCTSSTIRPEAPSNTTTQKDFGQCWASFRYNGLSLPTALAAHSGQCW